MFALLFPLLLAAPADDTRATVTAIEEAFATRDIAKASALFAPDASVTLVMHTPEPGREKRVPDEVFVGPEAVRVFLGAYLPGWESKATNVTADGERATWTWSLADDRFRLLGVPRLEASAEAVVRAGVVRSLTVTASPEQQPKLLLEIPDANKAVVRRFIDGVNKRDYSVLDSIIASSFEQHSYMPMGPGAKGLKDFYEEFSRAFPDFKFTLEDVMADGDRVAVRMTARYTHKGEFMGLKATNKAVTVAKFDIFRFAGGKCIEHWDSVDRLGLLQQLGVVPKIPRWTATPGYEDFR